MQTKIKLKGKVEINYIRMNRVVLYIDLNDEVDLKEILATMEGENLTVELINET
jgi:hypothetical protein